MQVLLTAATDMEIAPFRAAHPDMDVLITGVGSPATMYQLTRRLHQIDYNLVIQAGIAGSYHEGFIPGEVLLVEADCFADIGSSEQGVFTSCFDMGLADPDAYPFREGWLVNDSIFPLNRPLRKTRAVTVNTVTDSRNQTAMIETKFHPELESMEGAAFHYACLMGKVPFMQIRSISNKVGQRDKSRWHIKQAVDNLSEALNLIMKDIHGHRSS